jgi:hypothetical protein
MTTVYTLPKGTDVSICLKSDKDKQWQGYTTKKELADMKPYESKQTKGSSGALIFHVGKWLILVKKSKCIENQFVSYF